MKDRRPRKDTQAEERSFRYFVLGNITPVRLALNREHHVTGAQVPDPAELSGFRWSHEHWSRVEQSGEVDEVDRQTFEQAVERYLARRT